MRKSIVTEIRGLKTGGEKGIRTLEASEPTPFAGDRLQPLGHPSAVPVFAAPVFAAAASPRGIRTSFSKRPYGECAAEYRLQANAEHPLAGLEQSHSADSGQTIMARTIAQTTIQIAQVIFG